MSSHPPSYPYPHHTLPPVPSDPGVRLPSIKDLNFPPPGPEGQGTSSSQRRGEHAQPRHDPWNRPPAPSAQQPPPQHAPSHAQQHPSHPQHPPHPQHSPMPPPHEAPPKSHYAPHPKSDASYAPSGPPPPQPPPSVPPHPGVGAGTRSENPADKRSRPQQPVSASPRQPPHVSISSPVKSAPPPGYHHQAPPPSAPPPQEHLQHPPPSHYPPQQPPTYAPYPPPQMPSHPSSHQSSHPPHQPAHHQAQAQPQPPPSPYPPPHQPVEHWQQHPPPGHAPPPPPPQHQQFNGYASRATALAPPPAPLTPSPRDAERANARQGIVHEILQHCQTLMMFANRYGNSPSYAPPEQEIQDMNHRANEVVRLIEQLRRMDAGEDVARRDAYPVAANPADEHRPPKRPWEDMGREGEPSPVNNYELGDQAQSTAEQDMQIIRNKRQSSTGGAAGVHQKNKYRKRSRATPPGKCHSCNIRETPEWRRGPDGARTLCNACGLHYAKLMRKRDKTLDANGKAPPIDLQTLRASTASARGAGGNSSDGGHGEPSQSQNHGSLPPPPHQAPPPQSSYEQQKPPSMHGGPPPPHPGSYQLMPVAPPGSSASVHQMMPPPHGPPSAPHSAVGAPVPPPPWLSPSPSDRGGYNNGDYARLSHPPSHARASPQ
ncbi:uncharacterized protein BXZ73DRAFT_38982 [Epithele typhae]|uniref:uncharacterized protein n=1 Tax=Epithele typhae TaxID=378194 RepID=UPI0020079BDB|nr:uncharacterized protein BXZ73DRAFT_38982 [Epithele typhae]KAH9945086.1 hypothetical protein BXZ73DRAFT_38982 [Epithele typhae]